MLIVRRFDVGDDSGLWNVFIQISTVGVTCPVNEHYTPFNKFCTPLAVNINYLSLFIYHFLV